MQNTDTNIQQLPNQSGGLKSVVSADHNNIYLSEVDSLLHEYIPNGQPVNGHNHTINNTPTTHAPGKPIVYTLEDFEVYRITAEKNIPHYDPTIKISGASFATPGNMSVISAAPKGAKTAIAAVMIAGAYTTDISEDGYASADGFNSIQVAANKDNKAVICIDTEQAAADQQYKVCTITKRAGLTHTPESLHEYNFRSLSCEQLKAAATQVATLCAEKFGGIHLIVIDGGADFIKSVNDEEAAAGIIQFFIGLSIVHECPVIVIVHQNPGSEKERGHFGSEAQRKCYGMVSIAREGDVFTMQPKIMRKAGTGESHMVNFIYSKEKGYHIQIDAQDREELKQYKENEKYKKLAIQVFPAPNSYRYVEAIAKIMEQCKVKKTAAKDRLNAMQDFGFIEQGEDERYRLVVGLVAGGRNGSETTR